MRIPALILFSLYLVSCYGPSDVEMSPTQYSALLAEWNKRGLVDHFPKVIPADATNVRLSAFPGFMQGGGWFQVRFSLVPTAVASIHEEAAKRAKAFYDGGDIFRLVNSDEGGLAGTSFRTSDPQRSDFPEDYRVFVFDARPYRPGEAHQWNHGDSRGVVVSRERNEVIYFAEHW